MRLKPSKNKVKKISIEKTNSSGVLLETVMNDGRSPDGGAIFGVGADSREAGEIGFQIPIMTDMTEMEVFSLQNGLMIKLQYGSEWISEFFNPDEGRIGVGIFITRTGGTQFRIALKNQNSGRYADVSIYDYPESEEGVRGFIPRNVFIDGNPLQPPSGYRLQETQTVYIPSQTGEQPTETTGPAQYAQPIGAGEEETNITGSESQTTDLTISPFMPCGKLYINGVEQNIRNLVTYGDTVSVNLSAVTRGSKRIRIVAGDTPASTVTWERTVDVTGPTQTITPDSFGYLVINGFEPGWILRINNVVRSCTQQENTHYAVSSTGLKDIEVENNDGAKYSFKFNVVAGRNEIDMADYRLELPTMDLIGGNTDPSGNEPQENTGNNTGNNTGENPPIRNPPRDNTNTNRNPPPPRDNTDRNRTPPREDSNRNTGVGRNTNTGNNTSNNTNTTNTDTTQESIQYGTVTINGLPSGSIVVITQGTKRKELRPDSSGNVTDSRIETGTWNVKVTENGSPRNSMDRTIVVEQGRVALIDYSTNNTTPEEVSRLVICLNEGKSVVMRGPDGEVVRETPVRGSIEIDGLADGSWEITIMQGNRELEKRTIRIQKGQTVEIEIDPRENGIGVRREGEIAATEEGSNLVYWILGIGVVGGIGYYYRKEISKFLGLDKVDVAAKEKVEVKK